MIEKVTGAPIGFLGPVGLIKIPTGVDHAVAAMRNVVVGGERRSTST